MLYRGDILPNKLIQTIVVKAAVDGTEALPTVAVREIGARAKDLYQMGICAMKLFAKELTQDPTGQVAERDDSICGQALRAIKDAEPRMGVITETCICSATGGACVILDSQNKVDIAATMDRFRCIAVMQCRNGADILGPASMADGAVREVRGAADAAGFGDVALMPHVEFRSALYSTYRKVAGNGAGIYRHGLQVEIDQGAQFVAAGRLMVDEGADMLLVEPGMFFLDLVRPMIDAASCPVGIFSVSGEYKMLQSFDEDDRLAIHSEYLRSAFRAGADYVVTYAADQIARGLN
nr:hypothetical protein KS05_31915 [Rhizobium brockwellii]